MTAGENLRMIRERLGLTIRDVEAASNRLSDKYQNPEFAVSLSRLSDIETKGVVPSVFKLYSLAAIYRRDFGELLGLFGLRVENLEQDSQAVAIAKTHLTTFGAGQSIDLPVKLDPGFDPKTTMIVGRFIQAWGTVPVAHLAKFTDRRYTYGYIGMEDLTMYPLLLPGTFVQIDEKLNRVQDGGWRSEYERPIYMVETREQYFCAWCDLADSILTIRPHALSPAKSRSFELGGEAEIIGQVIGVAMRLSARFATSIKD